MARVNANYVIYKRMKEEMTYSIAALKRALKPVIDVIIAGRCFHALLDDGSENTFMSTRVAHQVKSCIKPDGLAVQSP